MWEKRVLSLVARPTRRANSTWRPLSGARDLGIGEHDFGGGKGGATRVGLHLLPHLVGRREVGGGVLAVGGDLHLHLGEDDRVEDHRAEEVLEGVAPDVVLAAQLAAAEGDEEEEAGHAQPGDGVYALLPHVHDHQHKPAEEQRLAGDSHRGRPRLGLGVARGERGVEADGGHAEAGEDAHEVGARRAWGAAVGPEAFEDVEELRVEAHALEDVLVADLLLEGAVEAGHHHAEQEGEGEPDDDRDVLERLEGAAVGGGDEGDGDDALGEAPEDLLPRRDERGREARGGDDVVGHRARVGRGEEVDDQAGPQHDVQEAPDVRVRHHDVVDLVVARHARQQVVARVGQHLGLRRDRRAARRVVLRALDRGVLGLGAHLERHLGDALHLDREAAEDGEPEDGEERGAHEAAEDDLLDGAAARDDGHEEADEGRPRDPPGPVEDGPPVHEHRVGVAVVGHGERAAHLVRGAAAPRGGLGDEGLGAARQLGLLPRGLGFPQGGARGGVDVGVGDGDPVDDGLFAQLRALHAEAGEVLSHVLVDVSGVSQIGAARHAIDSPVGIHHLAVQLVRGGDRGLAHAVGLQHRRRRVVRRNLHGGGFGKRAKVERPRECRRDDARRARVGDAAVGARGDHARVEARRLELGEGRRVAVRAPHVVGVRAAVA
mmetsp:Transcript_16195/g.38518  ORF Transcript_16195/g.38518 Transcript_16195/m.38518 type:complete len:660 (+) Transcript_16195:277-2256(+)